MEKVVNQLFIVFGEFKGGVMKVGQVLLVMEVVIFDEFGEFYWEVLIKLQKDVLLLFVSKVYWVFDGQLGIKWWEWFSLFNDILVVFVSIGQVYKVIWLDG